MAVFKFYLLYIKQRKGKWEKSAYHCLFVEYNVNLKLKLFSRERNGGGR